ncbi:unnamed protein product [Arctogadus glacialis]
MVVNLLSKWPAPFRRAQRFAGVWLAAGADSTLTILTIRLDGFPGLTVEFVDEVLTVTESRAQLKLQAGKAQGRGTTSPTTVRKMNLAKY